ncbi:MAG: hypothetical protein Q8Q62_06840, partial [Mesorhizobium sp.]|nr:hypothetical protein [Mesorhizobium sp.]
MSIQPRVHEMQRRAHMCVPQSRQPVRRVRRQRFDVASHHLHEHEFGDLGQNRLATGASRSALTDREPY